MKNTIVTILLFFAILLVGGGGYYLYTQLDSQVYFYVDEEEYYSASEDRDAASLSLPEDPSKAGYTFDGWYFDNGVWKDAYTATYFSGKKLPLKMSLYAKWVDAACDHSMGESDWIVDLEATCTAKGAQHKECTGCGYIMETQDIALVNHTPGAWTTTNQPTCTTKGDKVLKCLECNTILDTDKIETIPHTVSAIVEENRVEPTCVSEGSFDKVAYCSVCNSERYRETETIDMIRHNYVGELTYTIVNGEMVFNCQVACTSGCGLSEELEDVEVTRTLALSATCMAEGQYLYTYVYAGTEFTATSAIPITSHRINGVLHEDAISEDGYFLYDTEGLLLSASEELVCGSTATAYYICTMCEQAIEVTAVRHHVGTWQQILAPTCLDEGIETIHCEYCDRDAQRSVEKISHPYAYSLIPKNAQYTEFKVYGDCTTPGCSETVELEVLPSGLTVDPATCITTGLAEYTADYLVNSITLVLPMVDHRVGSHYVAPGTTRLPLTLEGVYYLDHYSGVDCGTDSYEGYYVCSHCQDSFAMLVYVPHTYSDWNTVTAPTCMGTGLKERICTVCDHVDSEAIGQLTHENKRYSLEYDASTETFNLIATCTNGCNTSAVAKEDVAVVESILIPPSCVETGVLLYTYTDEEDPTIVCTFSETIPVVDHTAGGYEFADLLDENGKINWTLYSDLPIVVFGDAPVSVCNVDYEGCVVCDVCHVSYSATIYRGHDYSEWQMPDVPSCQAPGMRERTCLHGGCDYYESELTSITPHDYIYTLMFNGDGDLTKVKILAACQLCHTATVIEDFDRVTTEIQPDPTCIGEGILIYNCVKNDILYVVTEVLIDDIHGFGEDEIKIEELMNADGTVNSNIDGIYIIEDTESPDGKTARGGYICHRCNKFVEVTVKIVR